MNTIILTKELKIKLLNAINKSELDLSEFPEFMKRRKYDLSGLSIVELKQLRIINRKVSKTNSTTA
ncbi:MAG: hypothetical protein ABIP35_04420 [Ginsengibacter sp.]